MSCECKSTTLHSSNKADLTLKVDFLFLDDSVCVPCGNTAQALSEAVDMLIPPLGTMGINLSVEKIHVTDQKNRVERFGREVPGTAWAQDAQRFRFGLLPR